MSGLTRADLIADFKDVGAPRADWRVGAEFERHVLSAANGQPMPYEGPLESALEQIASAPDAKAYREEGRIIAIESSWGSLTLEPGGQVELSGNPHTSLQAVHQEALSFYHTVQDAIGPEWVQLAAGYTPFAPLDAIKWVPKGRYAIMREHLAQTGALAHHMMKGTCATQASFDFDSEEDCANKVAVASAIAPIVLALTANSPYAEGKPNGFMSSRGNIWLHTDPARTGLPDAAKDFSFERWVDYLLDVPLLFRRDQQGNWLPGGEGATFRKRLGSTTAAPSREDWNLHQTSIFPEVRVKAQIEVRSPDAVSLPCAMAVVALYTGVLYDDSARNDVAEWAGTWWSADQRRDAMYAASREGLRGSIYGLPALELGKTLIGYARDGLNRLGENDKDWLAPLTQIVTEGRCPARKLLEACGPSPTLAELTRHASYLGEDPT